MPSSYTLGSRFESLVRELVQTGRYNNASEVIRDGLRMVEDRERQLAALDAALEQGLADAEQGRVFSVEQTRAEILKAIEGIKELRKTMPRLSSAEIREYIEEGRR